MNVPNWAVLCTSSHSDNEEKKNPQPHLHKNQQRGSDDKPKTASEIGHFTKEDKNTFNCAFLFNTVFMLCILLYRTGNGGNKLFVFVFVFVHLNCIHVCIVIS